MPQRERGAAELVPSQGRVVDDEGAPLSDYSRFWDGNDERQMRGGTWSTRSRFGADWRPSSAPPFKAEGARPTRCFWAAACDPFGAGDS